MHDEPPTDRIALVTGGGDGLGRAIALELARARLRVIVCGRRRAKLDETIALAERIGVPRGNIEALAADVTADDFTTRLSAIASKIDVVVHGAVHFPAYGSAESLDIAETRRVHDVAVFAPQRIHAHVLPGMRQRGFGRIVFLGSIAGTTGARAQSSYASAKSALHGLAKSIALETARFGITCNVVEPGIVLTDRVRAAIPEATRRALVEATPMRRAGAPEDVAALVGFLCSDRAGYITGAVIPVSGGLGLGLFPEPS